MTTRNRLALALAPICLAAAAASAPARAADSYDNCTSFIDSLPATISTQGVWCLRKNLATAITSGNAITIDTNNVTIDCNDFKIGGLAAGPASQAIGIYAASRLNATVRNCGIRGFLYGMQLNGGGGHLVENNRLDQNLKVGILATGEGTRTQGNRIFDTGGAAGDFLAYGAYLQGDVIDNTVEVAFAEAGNAQIYGLYVIGEGAEIRGNRVRGLVPGATGFARGIIPSATGMLVTDNVVVANPAVTGHGIYASGSSTFCTNNTVHGYVTGYHSCDYSAGNLPVQP